jgi:hypothetical protein
MAIMQDCAVLAVIKKNMSAIVSDIFCLSSQLLTSTPKPNRHPRESGGPSPERMSRHTGEIADEAALALEKRAG